MSSVFCRLGQSDIARLCSDAKSSVVLVAPNITSRVASALAQRAPHLQNVHLVFDCNEETFRLGYGEIAAVRRLTDAGLKVMQSPGLRSGVLIVDDQGWVFTPVPLSVEADAQSSETPNAILLTREQIREVIRALGVDTIGQNQLFSSSPEVGGAPLTEGEIRAVERSLEAAPPVPFDLQRQVRVFQPYIQYVELSLEGASIRRQTVTLPPYLARLAKSERVQERLRTTYSVIGEKSKLDDKPLHDALNKIRKDFTHTIPALSGNVMLRSKRARLDERVKELREKVDAYKKVVESKLDAELVRSRRELKRALVPLVLRNPPAELLKGCMGDKPTRDEVERWLEHELEEAFPKVASVLKSIELKVVYKDVTFEGLNLPELQPQLKRAFPAIDWTKPFAEFTAARECDGGEFT